VAGAEAERAANAEHELPRRRKPMGTKKPSKGKARKLTLNKKTLKDLAPGKGQGGDVRGGQPVIKSLRYCSDKNTCPGIPNYC
jgi:hypothetical protein